MFTSRKPLANLVHVAFLLCATILHAQQLPVAEWIDDNTALVVHFGRLDQTCEYLRDLPVYSNAKVQKAVRMLTDERFPIIRPDRWDEIKRLGSKFLETTAQIEEAAVIIHELSFTAAKVTVLIKSDEVTLKDCNALASEMALHLERANKPVEKDLSEPFDAENGDDAFFAGISGFKQTIVGDWMVVSNAPDISEELCRRLRGETTTKFRSLADSRKYQLAISRLKGMRGAKGLITVYGDPDRLRVLFPTYDDKTWKAMRVSEMPAFGGHVQLVSSAGKASSDEPHLLITGALLYTVPASGIGKVIETFRPIEELPPFAFPVAQLDARAVDEVSYYRASKEVYDSIHGEGSLDELYAKTYSENLYQDTLAKKSETFRFRFGNAYGPLNRELIIERIDDSKAMRKYLEFHPFRQLGYEEFHDGDAIVWRLSDENALRQHLRGYKAGSLEYNVALEKAKQDPSVMMEHAYAIVGDWSLGGSWLEVQAQIQFIRDGTDAHRDRLNQMIKGLQSATGNGSDPCMIRLSPNVAGNFSVRQLELAYLDKHYSREQIWKMNPNDGILLTPTSREENAVACGLLLAKGVGEIYGRQLMLCFKDEGAFHFAVGVYLAE